MLAPLQLDHALHLTFDDGPNVRLTPRILNVLRQYGARATFFVVGSRVRHPGGLEIIAQALADGHSIGNHTLTHPDLTQCSEGEIEHELTATALLLQPLAVRVLLFRPPYGRTNDTVRRVSEELGYRTVLWDNDSRDWSRELHPDKWVAAALSGVRDRGARTILCHDTHVTTADYLHVLIANLSADGYSFVSLEDSGTDTDLPTPPAKKQPPTFSI